MSISLKAALLQIEMAVISYLAVTLGMLEQSHQWFVYGFPSSLGSVHQWFGQLLEVIISSLY